MYFLITIVFVALICWICFRIFFLRMFSKAAKNQEKEEEKIPHSSKKKKIVDKDMGEYVDYEQVKDDKNENV